MFVGRSTFVSLQFDPLTNIYWDMLPCMNIEYYVALVSFIGPTVFAPLSAPVPMSTPTIFQGKKILLAPPPPLQPWNSHSPKVGISAFQSPIFRFLHAGHVMLATGRQGSKPSDNLSAFRPCIFMNTLWILMGISELSMRVAPIILFLISAAHFLFFLSARGA